MMRKTLLIVVTIMTALVSSGHSDRDHVVQVPKTQIQHNAKQYVTQNIAQNVNQNAIQTIVQNEEKVAAALLAASDDLKAIDNADYELSRYSTVFQTAVTQEQWAKQLKAFRGPLGKTISRNVMSSEYMTTLPGMPDGEYVVLQFTTVFENKKLAYETVTMIFEEGELLQDWKLGGYFIK